MDGTFDINDTKLVSSDKLVFSHKGEKKRICVRDDKIAMVGVHAVLVDKRRRLKLCTQTESQSCKYCDQGFLPSPRYGLRVFEYFNQGGIFDIRLISWVFSQDKLEALKKGLGKKVLKSSEWELVCTNDTFQAFSIKPTECLLKKHENLRNKAKALSAKVKADGVTVLKALLSPTMPTESTKKGGRGGYGGGGEGYDQYPEYGGGDFSKSPPNFAKGGVVPPQEVTVPTLPQGDFDDVLPGSDPLFSEDPVEQAPPISPEIPVSPEPSVSPEAKKEEAWEKSLNDILGDF